MYLDKKLSLFFCLSYPLLNFSMEKTLPSTTNEIVETFLQGTTRSKAYTLPKELFQKHYENFLPENCKTPSLLDAWSFEPVDDGFGSICLTNTQTNHTLIFVPNVLFLKDFSFQMEDDHTLFSKYEKIGIHLVKHADTEYISKLAKFCLNRKFSITLTQTPLTNLDQNVLLALCDEQETENLNHLFSFYIKNRAIAQFLDSMTDYCKGYKEPYRSSSPLQFAIYEITWPITTYHLSNFTIKDSLVLMEDHNLPNNLSKNHAALVLFFTISQYLSENPLEHSKLQSTFMQIRTEVSNINDGIIVTLHNNEDVSPTEQKLHNLVITAFFHYYKDTVNTSNEYFHYRYMGTIKESERTATTPTPVINDQNLQDSYLKNFFNKFSFPSYTFVKKNQ